MYPILLEFGPFSIHSLWFFITVGLVASSILFVKLVKRQRMKLDWFVKHSFAVLLVTLLSSRLLFFILHFADFSRPLREFFRVWDKGLSFWGALAGFLLVTFYFSKKHGESFLRFLDIIALPIVIGLLIASVGMFLDGIGHGKDTNLPWGITFQSAVVKYAVPVHPTQLYALTYLLMMFIFIYRASKYWMLNMEGFTFQMTAWMYSLFRFLEEFFRGDDTVLLFSVLRVPQLIAIVTFAFFTWQFLYRSQEPTWKEAARKVLHALLPPRSHATPEERK